MPAPAVRMPTGLQVDYSFSVPDFDVKDWINNALDSVPKKLPNDASSSSPSADDTSADASLDASLSLLQTPAHDPVLAERDLDDLLVGGQDALSTSTPPSSKGATTTHTTTTSTTTTTSHPSTSTTPSTATTALTQHATTHLTKLHLLARQISTNLNNTTMDVVKLLPRLTHEIDQLRQETRLLQEGIRLVQGDVAQVERATMPTTTAATYGAETAATTTTTTAPTAVSALEQLKYLDRIKTRMEATHAALREAENWRNLESEAQEIFARGDFVRAATRLAEAERSLVVYKNTHVEEDRMALLQVLKDQLEQQVMERTRTALVQRDTAACQALMSVFGRIGRQERFQECYFALRRTPLVEAWKKQQLVQQQHAPSSKEGFITFLQGFYSDAATMLSDEFAWGNSIFSEPAASIHGLVRHLFSHLDPTMAATLQQVAAPLGDEGKLPLVLAAFSATVAFGARIERVVAQPLVGHQREPTSARTTTAAGALPSSTASGAGHGAGATGRRSRSGTLLHGEEETSGSSTNVVSKTFSTASLAELNAGLASSGSSALDGNAWAYILYEPFLPYQRDYGRLEAAHLRALLIQQVPGMEAVLQMAASSNANMQQQQRLLAAKHCSNLVKLMTATNQVAFSLAEAAIGRCIKLTHGFGAAGLVEGVNEFLGEILTCFQRMLIFYRHKSGLLLEGEKPDPMVAQVAHLAATTGSGGSASLSRLSPRPGNSRFSNSNDPLSEEEENDDSDGWDEDEDEGAMDDQGSPRLFQMGLRLMVLCRQFCQRLHQLDLKTKQALVGVEALLEMGHDRADDRGSDTMQLPSWLPPLPPTAAAAATTTAGESGRTTTGATRSHRLSIVEPRDHAAVLAASMANHPLQRLPQASVALLQQSSLNSFRLTEILGVVKRAQEAGELGGPGSAGAGAVGAASGTAGTSTAGARDGKGGAQSNNNKGKNEVGLECSADHLYRASYERAAELTRLCQRFIFDTMYIPLVRPLAGVASLACWTEGLDPHTGKDTSMAHGVSPNAGRRTANSQQSTMGGTRTDVYRFRTGPSEYMEEVWRRLDALLKFGVYAGDEGLRFGIQALPYADRPVESDHDQEGDEHGVGVGEASAAEDLSSGPGADRREQDEEDNEEDDDSDEVVFHRWMTSLARATMHTLIDRLYDPERAGSMAALVRALQPNKTSGNASAGSPSLDYRARMAATQNQPPSRTGSPAHRDSSEMLRSQSPAPGSASLQQQQSLSPVGLIRLSEAGVKQLETDLVFLVTESLPSLGIDPTPNVEALRRALGMSKADLLRTIEQMESELDKFLEAQEKKRRDKKKKMGGFGGLEDGEDEQEEEKQEALGEGSASALPSGKKDAGSVAAAGATPSPVDTLSSAFVAGIPALPSTLTATEENVELYLKQEKAIHEWVAKLRGLTVK